MDSDELFPGRPDDPMALVQRQDLDPLSVDELDARIAALEAEIVRVKTRRTYAVAHKANAEALFKR